MNDSKIKEFEKLLKNIEGYGYSALVNMASNIETMKKIILKSKEFISLQNCFINLKDNEGLEIILNRILKISENATDPNFESPWDIELSALLLFIDKTSQQYLSLALSLISITPNIWLAQIISRQLYYKVDKPHILNFFSENNLLNTDLIIDYMTTAQIGPIKIKSFFSQSNQKNYIPSPSIFPAGLKIRIPIKSHSITNSGKQLIKNFLKEITFINESGEEVLNPKIISYEFSAWPSYVDSPSHIENLEIEENNDYARVDSSNGTHVN